MKIKINALKEQLNAFVYDSTSQDTSIGKILETLGDKGQALLIIFFSLPFCQPIQIPGFSTPFGIILFFIGLSIAFKTPLWLPKSVLEKRISQGVLKKWSAIVIKITEKLQFLISTRWTFLVKNPYLHRLHGLMIALLAILLALPLPIPFTNLLAAYPLLTIGLGIVEDDGCMIVIGYCLSSICFIFFIALFLFGKEAFDILFYTQNSGY